MQISPTLKRTTLCCVLSTFHTYAWTDLIAPVNGFNHLNPQFHSLPHPHRIENCGLPLDGELVKACTIVKSKSAVGTHPIIDSLCVTSPDHGSIPIRPLESADSGGPCRSPIRGEKVHRG